MNGVTLVYQEPPEARMPSKRWRLYVFKGDAEASEPLLLHKQTHYLVGRERRVASIPTDHPSCSKQARHAAASSMLAVHFSSAVCRKRFSSSLRRVVRVMRAATARSTRRCSGG